MNFGVPFTPELFRSPSRQAEESGVELVAHSLYLANAQRHTCYLRISHIRDVTKRRVAVGLLSWGLRQSRQDVAEFKMRGN